MRYLHTMLRVRDLDAAIDFFCNKLGLIELRRRDSERGRFTLVFLGSGAEGDSAMVELTHNWDETDPYDTGRYFGHLAYAVDDKVGAGTLSTMLSLTPLHFFMTFAMLDFIPGHFWGCARLQWEEDPRHAQDPPRHAHDAPKKPPKTPQGPKMNRQDVYEEHL